MEPFTVVTACDEKYAQHASVMLRSLLENNQKIRFRIFILIPAEFPADIQLKITNSMPTGEYSLTFLRVRYQNLSSLPISEWITVTTYYRFIIADLLPAEITQVLYLDSDILVVGDISALLHLDLSQYALAAVDDYEHTHSAEFKQQINMDRSTPYFKAGVILLNLDRWRSENIGRRAIEFAAAYPQHVVFWDQCALNHIIHGNFLVLPEEWNLDDERVEKKKQISAKIVHFAGRLKPWHYMSNHSFKRDYFAYLSRTHWADYRYPDYTLRNFVLKKAHRLYSPISKMLPYEQRLRVQRLVGYPDGHAGWRITPIRTASRSPDYRSKSGSST